MRQPQAQAISTALMQQAIVHITTHRHTPASGSGSVAPRGTSHPDPSFGDQPLDRDRPHQPARPGGGTASPSHDAVRAAGKRLLPVSTAVPSRRRAGLSDPVQGAGGEVELGGLERGMHSNTTRDAEQERRIALLFGSDDEEGGGDGEGASSGDLSDMEEGLPEATEVSCKALDPSKLAADHHGAMLDNCLFVFPLGFGSLDS